ncbi:hypothetical protein Ahia01_000169400 [Argonauta hians]
MSLRNIFTYILCLLIVKVILYDYTSFPKYLPLIEKRVKKIWFTILEPKLDESYYFIASLCRNFNLHMLYDKLYSFGCLIFMPLYNSYVFKICKSFYNKHILPVVYVHITWSTLIECFVLSLLTYLFYKVFLARPEQPLVQNRLDSSRMPPRVHYESDREPYSDDDDNDDHNSNQPNRVADENVDLYTYKNSSRRNCSTCKQYEFNAVVLPCGHTALCLKCALKYYYHERKCPVCNKEIWTIHRIYL